MNAPRNQRLVKVLDKKSSKVYACEVGSHVSERLAEDDQRGARRTRDSTMQDPQGITTPQHTFQRLALALLAQAESEMQSRAPKRRSRNPAARSAPPKAS